MNWRQTTLVSISILATMAGLGAGAQSQYDITEGKILAAMNTPANSNLVCQGVDFGPSLEALQKLETRLGIESTAGDVEERNNLNFHPQTSLAQAEVEIRSALADCQQSKLANAASATRDLQAADQLVAKASLCVAEPTPESCNF